MRRICVALLILAGVAVAQTRKEFEVASIRQTADQPVGTAGAGLRVDGSQVRIGNLSLKDYVAMAYEMRVNQVVGPDWLSSVRYDVAAKLPEGSDRADVRPMIQSLLEDRFQLKAHRDMREFPVYVLEVAKTGLTVKESTPDGDPFARKQGALTLGAAGGSAGVSIDLGEGSFFNLTASAIETRNLTMFTLANMLTRFLDRPVVDQTNLKGGYDLKLDLTQEDRNMLLVRSAVAAGVVLTPQALALLNNGPADSLTNSLKKVGLTLDGRKAPLDVVVVDQMQKTPSEN